MDWDKVFTENIDALYAISKKRWDKQNDWLHDTYINLRTNKTDLEITKNPKHYILKAAFNNFRSYKRKISPIILSNNGQLSAKYDIQDTLEQAELLQVVTAIVKTMPPRRKEVMELILAGNTQQEISDKLSLAMETIKHVRLLGIQDIQKKLKLRGQNENSTK